MIEPSTTCEHCGGYVAWQEREDRWEGSCFGRCGGYYTKHKPLTGNDQHVLIVL